MLNFKSIEKAYSDIKNSIKKTPLMECKTLDEMLGCETYLKLENLQKTGSFKIRGAINKIMNLTEEEKKKRCYSLIGRKSCPGSCTWS